MSYMLHFIYKKRQGVSQHVFNNLYFYIKKTKFLSFTIYNLYKIIGERANCIKRRLRVGGNV